jgi:hypothetical protein
MKVYTYKTVPNTGVLTQTGEKITIKKNRWVDREGTSHPMKFEEPIAFEDSHVYYLLLFGSSTPPNKGVHVSLTFFQNQKFLWLQNKHWLQQKDNIMWVINILVAILAIIAALK